MDASGRVQINLKPGSWIPVDLQMERLRRPAESTADWAVGDKVQYFSSSRNTWLDCEITNVRGLELSGRQRACIMADSGPNVLILSE